MVRKPTIFLIDSDLIDVDILVLKIERKFSCNIYTFFNTEEVLIYKEIIPDIFIIDEETFRNKSHIIEEIITKNKEKSDGIETQFVVYSASGFIDIRNNLPIHDKVNLVKLDSGYNNIQVGLDKILG